MMQFLCRVIGHRRSKRRARPWLEGWQSECILCETRLARVSHGKWVPVSSLTDGVYGRQPERG